MECIRRVGPAGGGVGERLDDLQLLDGGARPPVRHDKRQRVRVRGAHVNEVDVHPVDLGDEVRQRDEALLELAPVVTPRPIVGQCLNRVELHTLGGIGLPIGPPSRRDPSTKVCQLVFRSADGEGANLGGGLGGAAHHDPAFRSDRNAARISSANSCGSSQAAKCPPLSASLK